MIIGREKAPQWGADLGLSGGKNSCRKYRALRGSRGLGFDPEGEDYLPLPIRQSYSEGIPKLRGNILDLHHFGLRNHVINPLALTVVQHRKGIVDLIRILPVGGVVIREVGTGLTSVPHDALQFSVRLAVVLVALQGSTSTIASLWGSVPLVRRSEERRVGKECW